MNLIGVVENKKGLYSLGTTADHLNNPVRSNGRLQIGVLDGLDLIKTAGETEALVDESFPRNTDSEVSVPVQDFLKHHYIVRDGFSPLDKIPASG